jgi:hypothetical protein
MNEIIYCRECINAGGCDHCKDDGGCKIEKDTTLGSGKQDEDGGASVTARETIEQSLSGVVTLPEAWRDFVVGWMVKELEKRNTALVEFIEARIANYATTLPRYRDCTLPSYYRYEGQLKEAEEILAMVKGGGKCKE